MQQALVRVTYKRAIGAVAGVPIFAQLCTVLIGKGVRRRVYKGDRLVSVSLID
jgi:DNA-binding transcriptional regulator YhcF (GntR family)